MRIGIIVVGVVLLILGIVLLPVGDMIISESQHWYSGAYQGSQDKELLLLGELVTALGMAGIAAGLITAIAGFVRSAKRTKVEKLETEIKVKKLKSELKALKK